MIVIARLILVYLRSLLIAFTSLFCLFNRNTNDLKSLPLRRYMKETLCRLLDFFKIYNPFFSIECCNLPAETRTESILWYLLQRELQNHVSVSVWFTVWFETNAKRNWRLWQHPSVSLLHLFLIFFLLQKQELIILFSCKSLLEIFTICVSSYVLFWWRIRLFWLLRYLLAITPSLSAHQNATYIAISELSAAE